MSGDFEEAGAKPHFLGHRERLRERFMAAGPDALLDYELLELVLFRALPRQDTKPLAKLLIDKFGSFAEVLGAKPERLKEHKGVGDAVVTEIKLIEAASLRLIRGSVIKRPGLIRFVIGPPIDPNGRPPKQTNLLVQQWIEAKMAEICPKPAANDHDPARCSHVRRATGGRYADT